MKSLIIHIICWILMIVGFILLIMFSGCSRTSVITPTGWKVNIEQGFMSRSIDVGDLIVEPNSVIRLHFENYKSDSQKAMELVRDAFVAGAAAGAIAKP